jgi:hypothetical protein
MRRPIEAWNDKILSNEKEWATSPERGQDHGGEINDWH